MVNIEIYTWETCPFCIRAKKLLDRKGVEYKEYDASKADTKKEMEDRSGRTSVPQIFIDGKHIGGCDDLYELDYDDKLDDLLNDKATQNGPNPT